jgi:hypothetical protein
MERKEIQLCSHIRYKKGVTRQKNQETKEELMPTITISLQFMVLIIP